MQLFSFIDLRWRWSRSRSEILYKGIERRRTFTSIHRLWVHTHFLFASKSVEYLFSAKRGRNNNNNHQHQNIKGPITEWILDFFAIRTYVQRAHMRSHSLWFSFLAFGFRFVSFGFSLFCTHSVVRPVCSPMIFFSVELCGRDVFFFFSSSIVVAFDIRIAKKRSRNR